MNITREEWLAAIHEAMPEPVADDSALTVTEFAKLARCAKNTAQATLLQWVESGRATPCQKWVRRTDGRLTRATAYRLVTH